MVPFYVQILTNFTYHVSKNQFSCVTNLTCLNKGAKPKPNTVNNINWIKIFTFYLTIAASSRFRDFIFFSVLRHCLWKMSSTPGACIKPGLGRRPLCRKVYLPSCVARQPLWHEINLPRCEAGLQNYQSSLASHSRNLAVGVNPLRNSLTILTDYLSNKVSDAHLVLTLGLCGSK